MIKKKIFTVVLVSMVFMLTACGTTATTATATKEAPAVTKQREEPKDPPNVEFAKQLQAFLEKGDTKGAIAHFANIPAELSEDIELKLLLGALYYSDAQFDNAIYVANEVLEKDPGNMDALELISMANYSKGDKKAYSATASQILKADPNNTAVNLQKAQDYATNKKWKLARQSYQKALKGDPTNEDAMFGYAQMSYYTDDLDIAAEYFQKILDKHPDDAAALAYMGKLSYDDGNYLRASNYAREALKYDPNNYDYWMDLGTYQRYQGKFDDAASSWKKATEIDPNYFLAYAYLAGNYDDLGKFDLALQNYQKVIETNPDYYFAYESAAILAFHEKNYEDAIKYFSTAYKYSDHWSYVLMIAACYYKLNNPQGAKKAIQTQLKKMQNTTTEYSLLRFFGEGYSKNAESQLNQKINKEDNRNTRGKMLFYMGLYCEINGGKEIAKDYYAKVTSMQAPMFFEYRLAEWGIQE